jgi:hypothetical protein
MGDPDYCENKCPICTKARQGNRLARLIQAIEMLVTFGGCPHGRSRRKMYGVKPNEPLPLDATSGGSVPTLDELLAEINSTARRLVKEGFEDEEAVIQDVTEQYESEYRRDDLGPHVARITRERLQEHYRAQASWPTSTDCDKLDSMFANLEQQGIVARQNFTCCQNCGHAEIGAEIAKASKVREVKGYAFYHMQDTERAAETGTLYIAYASRSGMNEDSLAVGRTIVSAIRRVGLNADWDGSLNTRICITGLDWKRRRS